jgi:CheY-like chemotaxis protein
LLHVRPPVISARAARSSNERRGGRDFAETARWAPIEELRADRATAGLPIVLCSAAIRSLDQRAAWLAERGVAVVPKPFELDDLLTAIWQGLGRA